MPSSPKIPETMRAAQISEFNKPYEVNTVPVPCPSSLHPHDLLVRIGVASLCHTDFMVSSGVFPASLPQTGSHEGAGTVAAMGKDVEGWRLGDRVMIGLQTHRCGDCVSCNGREDERQYCEGAATRAPGVGRDGCFGEFVTADSRESNKIPDSVRLETAGPLASCAGRTVFRGIIQARLQPGQHLGLVGSGGGLGHLGIQFAKASGLKVIAIDARDEGIALSKELGADVVLDARQGKEKVVQRVREVTGGGCDSTVNVSDAEGAAGLACAITRMHGRMIQIAQPEEVSVPFAEIIFRNIKIEGSLIASQKQGEDMLEAVARHGIRVKTTALHGLDKVNELVELSHSGKMQGKGVIIVDEEALEREKELGARY